MISDGVLGGPRQAETYSNVSGKIALYNGESSGSEEVKELYEAFRCLEERNGIDARVGDGDIGE